MSEQSTRVAQRAGWLAYNMRWLLLVAAVVLVLSSPRPPSALTIVLLAGGAIYNFVLTLVEFAEPGHLPVFQATLAGAKQRVVAPMNVFIERGAIEVWARELGLTIVEFRNGGDHVVAEGNLGQAICVLEKPL